MMINDISDLSELVRLRDETILQLRTAASEQGRVIAELRAQLAEFVSAYDAYIEAPIYQSTAWMDAIARLDALRNAVAPETAQMAAQS